jgi:alpha 1,3-glucosidase
MRPLFYEFPDESNLFAREDEYMVGNALLIRPVTDAGVTSVDVSLPKGAVWYNYFTGKPMEAGVQHTVSATLDEPTPVFQRGGTIVPTLQRVRRSSKIMMNDPYTLIVALDKTGKAKGYVYIDDGQSFKYREGANLYIEVTFDKGVLHGSMLHQPGYKSGAWLERVIIYGYQTDTPKIVKVKSVSGGESELDFSLHSDTKTLVIKRPGISLSEDGWSISIH